MSELLQAPGNGNITIPFYQAGALINSAGDQLGHAHDNGQAGVLQDEVFHITAYVDDARKVQISHCRETFIYPGPGSPKTPGARVIAPTFSDCPRQASTAMISGSGYSFLIQVIFSLRLLACTGSSRVP